MSPRTPQIPPLAAVGGYNLWSAMEQTVEQAGPLGRSPRLSAFLYRRKGRGGGRFEPKGHAPSGARLLRLLAAAILQILR